MEKPVVSIVMGSDSDLSVMNEAAQMLDSLGYKVVDLLGGYDAYMDDN